MRFRLLSFIFGILTIALIIATLVIGYRSWMAWTAVILISVFFLVNIYGSAVIRSGFYLPALSAASTNEKEIVLSFDDGPHPEFTAKILDTLKKHSASATFFLIGKNIEGNEDLVKRIAAEGHLIGNHSWSHGYMIDFKMKSGWIAEIASTSKLIRDLTGKTPLLFRPPYGVTTPHMAQAVKAMGIQVLGWSIRSLDTTGDSEEKIYERVTMQMKPGAVILFHDTSQKSVDVLEKVLVYAQNNGFKIASADRLFNIRPYLES
jgi:peptidoglycan/xylan/chitin deacetylase (PgdA/CDA1 family)